MPVRNKNPSLEDLPLLLTNSFRQQTADPIQKLAPPTLGGHKTMQGFSETFTSAQLDGRKFQDGHKQYSQQILQGKSPESCSPCNRESPDSLHNFKRKRPFQIKPKPNAVLGGFAQSSKVGGHSGAAATGSLPASRYQINDIQLVTGGAKQQQSEQATKGQAVGANNESRLSPLG